MKKILVVCHGAINRSPAAAAVLRCYPHLDVRVAAMKEYGEKTGRPKATKKMQEAMHRLGNYTFSTHRAFTITQADVDWADQIAYMDGGNRKRLEEKFPDCVPKLICLALAPAKRIADPNFLSKNDPKFQEIVEIIINSSKAFAVSLR